MKSSFISLTAALTLLLGAAQAQAAQDMRVRVYNRSNYTVYSIQVSPTYRGRYGGRDLLGDNVLRSGYNISIDFDVRDAEEECVLDVRAKGPGSIKWEKRMNVCRESEWNLYD